MVENPRAWSAVRKTGVEIQGDSLTRAPAGFDPAHRFVEDLRRKDLYSLSSFSQREVCAADFLDRYVAVCREAAPLVRFVTTALGWKWQ